MEASASSFVAPLHRIPSEPYAVELGRLQNIQHKYLSAVVASHRLSPTLGFPLRPHQLGADSERAFRNISDMPAADDTITENTDDTLALDPMAGSDVRLPAPDRNDGPAVTAPAEDPEATTNTSSLADRAKKALPYLRTCWTCLSAATGTGLITHAANVRESGHADPTTQLLWHAGGCLCFTASLCSARSEWTADAAARGADAGAVPGWMGGR